MKSDESCVAWIYPVEREDLSTFIELDHLNHVET